MASVDQIESLDARRASAFDEAIGVYCDNPDVPSVTALVWQGKLAQLQIADAVCRLAAVDAAAMVNAVIVNAFSVWRIDYMQRLRAA